MSKTFTGGCACGAIRYACDGEPVYMGKCHCRDCQRATGSAFFPAVVVKDTDLLMLSGEARWYESKADRGHVMRRGFCANCGSPVFLVNEARANVIILYAGNLDDPGWFKPSRDIFVASAQPWDLMHDDLPKFDRMPG